MIPQEIFECSCVDGFTGDFCEFKTEQDHLLFAHRRNLFVFNADGRLIEENSVNDKEVYAYRSCSTMLNGEAVIFGADSTYGTTTDKQVHLNILFNNHWISIISDFGGF